MITTNKVPDDVEYYQAYRRYLEAFIMQFSASAKMQDKQNTLLLTSATALGVRDGNAAEKSASVTGLPMSERGFRVAVDVMLGHVVPGKEPEVG